MDWQEERDELFKRNSLARNLGGPEKIERQHKGGRLTVRCLLYTSPSPRDLSTSRMPSSA